MDSELTVDSARYSSRRPNWQPARVIVGSDVVNDDVTTFVLKNVNTKQIFHIGDAARKTDRQILIEALNIPDTTSDSELTRLGRTSFLLIDSNELIQQMAAGPAMERRCFNFLKILPYTGVCPYDCAYCSFKDPVLIPRVNVRFFQRLPGELGHSLRSEGRTPTLFTFTHYKTDCFTMEHLTGFCRRAAEFFENEPGFGIQFLTKSDQVGTLESPMPKRAIVTFSVNPTWITKYVDMGTPPLEAGLAAARRLHSAGIPVMLRVDPILEFDGWRAAYDELAELVLDSFQPVHVTLGTPRFKMLLNFP